MSQGNCSISMTYIRTKVVYRFINDEQLTDNQRTGDLWKGSILATKQTIHSTRHLPNINKHLQISEHPPKTNSKQYAQTCKPSVKDGQFTSTHSLFWECVLTYLHTLSVGKVGALSLCVPLFPAVY